MLNFTAHGLASVFRALISERLNEMPCHASTTGTTVFFFCLSFFHPRISNETQPIGSPSHLASTFIKMNSNEHNPSCFPNSRFSTIHRVHCVFLLFHLKGTALPWGPVASVKERSTMGWEQSPKPNTRQERYSGAGTVTQLQRVAANRSREMDPYPRSPQGFLKFMLRGIAFFCLYCGGGAFVLLFGESSSEDQSLVGR